MRNVFPSVLLLLFGLLKDASTFLLREILGVVLLGEAADFHIWPADRHPKTLEEKEK